MYCNVGVVVCIVTLLWWYVLLPQGLSGLIKSVFYFCNLCYCSLHLLLLSVMTFSMTVAVSRLNNLYSSSKQSPSIRLGGWRNSWRKEEIYIYI
jgi:hypothetical protein